MVLHRYAFYEYREFLQTRLPALGIEGTIDLEGMNEDDWAESWKQYYKPVPLGKVTIVPAWEVARLMVVFMPVRLLIIRRES